MTNFARHATALAFTTLASALLLVAAVGPAHVAGHATAPVASSGEVMA